MDIFHNLDNLKNQSVLPSFVVICRILQWPERNYDKVARFLVIIRWRSIVKSSVVRHFFYCCVDK